MQRQPRAEREIARVLAEADKSQEEADRLAESQSDLTPEVASAIQDRRFKRTEARRAEALALRMAGLTLQDISHRLDVSVFTVNALLDEATQPVSPTTVEQLRELENQRLDRAQAAIWSRVLEGEDKAIATLLAISQRRSKLNGMDAPVQIDVSIGVRQEMEQALNELQTVVLGEVIERGDTDDGDTD